jgi:hypothetical protein
MEEEVAANRASTRTAAGTGNVGKWGKPITRKPTAPKLSIAYMQ